MPRPLWKGKVMSTYIYNSAISLEETGEDASTIPTLRVKRRNIMLSPSAKSFYLNRKFQLYTGYDFIDKTLNLDLMNYNLSTLVNTREINVRHKPKQSKHQKRNAVLGNAKKKLINVSKKFKSKIKSKTKKKMSKKK